MKMFEIIFACENKVFITYPIVEINFFALFFGVFLIVQIVPFQTNSKIAANSQCFLILQKEEEKPEILHFVKPTVKSKKVTAR